MKIGQRILMWIGIFSSVLFVVLAIAVVYFYVTFFMKDASDDMQDVETSQEAQDAHPYLTDEQEDLLRTFGIDPEDVPTEYTAEQEQCAREALGDERVDEIIGGDSPTVMDYYKARHCIE